MSLGTRINGYIREGSQRARGLILLQPSRSLTRGVLDGPRRIIDPDSGQVSRETTSRELQVSEYHWDDQFDELLEAYWEESDDDKEVTAKEAILAQSKRKKRRVPRLIQLSVDTILKNIGDVTYEKIQYMPSLQLEFLWRELSKRCVNSFNTWKAFSKALDRHEGAILNQFRYCGSIPEPVPSLSIYTKPLSSTSFDFLVHLSITTAFKTSDLVELSAMTNLVALEIVNPKHVHHSRNTGKLFDTSFGDRVIKTWSEGAISGKAFQVLRILKLRDFEEITNNCFQYLNRFPALAVFDVLDCDFNGLAQLGAERLGWEVHPDGGLLEILQSDCVKHIMALRNTLGLPVRPIRRSAAKPLRDKAKITIIPRPNLSAFLTGDPTSSSTPARNRAYLDAEQQVRVMEQTPAGREKLRRTGFSHFEAVDYISRKKIRELETWEFRTLTSLNRISELRNDEDFRAAGLEVGDSIPIVCGEIISAVPVASLRLGPELSYTPSRADLHQPFYDGGMSDRSLKYTCRKVGAKGYVYTRIKIPIARTRTREQAEGQDEGKTVDKAGGSGSRRAKRRIIKGEKRQQIGDLLAGVMGVI
ncbi:2dbfa8ad-d34e-46af-97d2-f4e6218a12f8 [Sclerotinia trifoliorum]|uniref:2dbfa8ad-d34e-46af-97d2-f4e6218a12f8 n=1 Tax=Sclerotinia trifoliorum TaxID=28548 RepID=A0A8H2VRZ2_9HELO|nr:2dbfa8ad-d34e-46af-97d2-f4e6218a12f8 [Sclerotinia trifoliorum]